MTIPADLYETHLAESKTYIATFTVEAGTPDEHEYDALNIDLPTLLDAINAEGLPIACPECGGLASLTVPVKNPMEWEVNTSHLAECGGPEEQRRKHLAEIIQAGRREDGSYTPEAMHALIDLAAEGGEWPI